MEENIREAATMVMIREQGGKVEVYLTRRPETMKFLPGFFVFPGGGVQDDDVTVCNSTRVTSSKATNVYEVAAIRECFEETGYLLLDSGGTTKFVGHCTADELFSSWIYQTGVSLGFDRMRYIGYRLTPKEVSAIRFSTRFFITVVPADIELFPSASEISEAYWVTPKAALEKWQNKKWKLVPPTVQVLQHLVGYSTAQEVFDKCKGIDLE